MRDQRSRNNTEKHWENNLLSSSEELKVQDIWILFSNLLQNIQWNENDI